MNTKKQPKTIIKKFTLRFYDNKQDKNILEWLEQFKQNYKYSKTELIKKILFDVSNKKCPNIKKEDKTLKLIFEINKIGNNINQIAKKTNFTKKVDLQVLEELRQIKEQLNKVIENVN